jgi:hypothetical protein
MRRRQGKRCGWLVVPGALLLAGSAVAATINPRAGSYLGTTAQALPLSFGVTAGSRQVTNFEPTFTARCTKPGAPSVTTPKITTDAGRTIQIKHNGFNVQGLHGKVRSGTHVIATGTDMVTGKFVSATKAEGTYSVALAFNGSAPGGLAGYRCSTGKLNWTAERR